jgi:murein DD-endopeptidase MepM/ murein hydrolase activator NlpD
MFHSKNKNKYHNYIIVSEKETGAKHFHLSQKKLITLSSLAILIISITLFLSADTITGILYEAKVEKLKSNYDYLKETLVDLELQLENVSSQIEYIEEKDNAIRTYTGLPQIDKGIRELGVGGSPSKKLNLSGISNEFTNRLSNVELNVDALSRKVKLELSSYNSLADKVVKYSENLKIIPSIRPVKEGYLGSSYGYRNDPFTEKVRFHYGQDFAVNTGTKIYSPANGKVKYANIQGGYGKVVKIDHGNGFRTIYAHLSKINVKHGSSVKRGDLIAFSGNSGRSAGPHLHYEVHQYGAPQNPLDYFFSGYLK